MPPKRQTLSMRVRRGLASAFDPGVLLHVVRMAHYYGYSHVRERRKIRLGSTVRLAPNTSFRNGERIVLGDRVQVGEYTALWAGRERAEIRVGAGTTFGPNCYVTAANYGLAADRPVTEQEMIEADVVIGAHCWIGTRTVITAGVTLGDGCVIGAGSVVTRDVPANAIAAGVPAQVIRMRE